MRRPAANKIDTEVFSKRALKGRFGLFTKIGVS
jgi:hypothetical protein